MRSPFLSLLLSCTLPAPILPAADKVEPVDKAWLEENYTKYEYRIPMRDGVKLHTAVYAPKDVSARWPVWMLRTPYSLDAYHTFRRGHRIMVQIQSSWFPLVDRNPQTFCDIHRAAPDDFRKATQRVYREPAAPSAVRVNVLPATK